jgi:hypothetical protein
MSNSIISKILFMVFVLGLLVFVAGMVIATI